MTMPAQHRRPRARTGCRKKRRFPSEQDARDCIERLAERGAWVVPSTAYRCPHCGGWHLARTAWRP